MSDLSLNLADMDFQVINNDLVFTSDVNTPGTNNILQDILQRLRLFQGEWFLDNSIGIPWFQQIFVKNPDVSKIEAIFIDAILSTNGVDSLIEFSLTPNYPNRSFALSFSANTTSGVVDYSGTLVSGGQQ